MTGPEAEGPDIAAGVRIAGGGLCEMLMQLDVRTLMLVSSLAYAMPVFIAVLTWRAYPAERFTRDWAIGASMAAASIVLLSLRGIIPDFLSIVAANTGLLIGQGYLLIANRRHFGRPPGRSWVWGGGAVAAVLLALFTYALPSLTARVVLVSLGMGVVNCLSAWEFWRAPQAAVRLARRLALFSYGLLGVAGLLRAVVAPLTESESLFLAASPVEVAFQLGQILAISALSASLAALMMSRLQLKLSQSELLYRGIIEQMSDVFYRTDVQGRLVLVSPSALATLGYASMDDLLGRPVETFWQMPAQREVFLALLRAGPVRDYEASLIKKDGTALPVSVSCHYYVDAAGRLAGVEGIIRDITERKAAQEALRAERSQLAEKVETRTAELRAMNTDLTRAVRSRDEFLSTMSHELRTPLTSIMGLAELMLWQLKGPLNAEQQTQVRQILQSGQHLLRLVDDVLDMAKVISGRLTLEPTLVAVEEVCQACLRPARPKAQQRGISLRYARHPDALVVRADGQRLQQILANLLDNAIKFTPPGGEAGLEVRANPAAQVVHLVVWDTGIGIAPEDLPRLFQHFVQLDSRLSRKYEGTGLGLALAKRLTELHGGILEGASDGLGHGSCFTVTLPWQPMELPTARPDSEPQVCRG